MLLSQSNIFTSSPRGILISPPVGFVVSPMSFLISPVENLLLGLTTEKFWKFGIFYGTSSGPHRGTETGCILSYTSNHIVVVLAVCPAFYDFYSKFYTFACFFHYNHNAESRIVEKKLNWFQLCYFWFLHMFDVIFT